MRLHSLFCYLNHSHKFQFLKSENTNTIYIYLHVIWQASHVHVFEFPPSLWNRCSAATGYIYMAEGEQFRKAVLVLVCVWDTHSPAFSIWGAGSDAITWNNSSHSFSLLEILLSYKQYWNLCLTWTWKISVS